MSRVHPAFCVLVSGYFSTSGQWITASEQGRDWCRLDKGVHLVMPALATDEALDNCWLVQPGMLVPWGWTGNLPHTPPPPPASTQPATTNTNQASGKPTPRLPARHPRRRMMTTLTSR